MATSRDYGLGDFDFPRGWFMIGAASEATRIPAPIRYFGKDLVLYRGESGTPYVVDAYCPHMGTHLARKLLGGIVAARSRREQGIVGCERQGGQLGTFAFKARHTKGGKLLRLSGGRAIATGQHLAAAGHAGQHGLYGSGNGVAQGLRGLVLQVGAVDEMLLDALLKHEGPMIPAACYSFCSKG